MHGTAADQRTAGCGGGQFREGHPYRHGLQSQFTVADAPAIRAIVACYVGREAQTRRLVTIALTLFGATAGEYFRIGEC